MSFREKSAWISFLLLLAISIAYFWSFTGVLRGTIGGQQMFHLFLLLFLLFIVGEIVLHAIVAIQSPRDAKAPKDERDRLIDLKATRIAFLVLLTGSLLSIFLIHFDIARYVIVHAMLLAVVVAELSMLGARIVYYRLGQ